MKILVSQLYRWDVEDCNVDDIFRCCVDILYRYFIFERFGTNVKSNFSEILFDIGPENIWKCGYNRGQKYSYEEAVIRKTLSMLSMLDVKKQNKVLIELDEPDENILPLHQNVSDAELKANDLGD
jgi:hypothetical protein